MKYDYGDEVIFRTQDLCGNVMEKAGAIVGITPIENTEQSRYFDHPIGSGLYTIEFGDGSDALLPEEQLHREVDESPGS